MLYSQSDVYAAALAAYQASACADPEYHERKAQAFVERAVRAQNFERPDMGELFVDIYDEEPSILEEYLHNVCYAALDIDCTNAFWAALGR